MQSAARRFTNHRYGGLFAPQTDIVAVGIEPIMIRGNNPNCIIINVSNSGNTIITLSYRPDVSNNQGYILGGNGSMFTSRIDLDADLVGYPLYAISNVGGGEVVVIQSLQQLSTEGED